MRLHFTRMLCGVDWYILSTFRDSHSVHSSKVKQSGHISMEMLLHFKSGDSKVFETRKPFFLGGGAT